jgi:cobalt-zinc-cadmium efflux system protein
VTRARRLAVALGLNGALVVAEAAAAVASGSTALLADAGHNLADVAALGLALAAARWATRPASEARSYGNHRATILAALANAAVLAVVTCGVAALGIDRLVDPIPVSGGVDVAVGAVALVVNGAAALLLVQPGRDLNVRSALAHMAGDAAASLGVVVAGAIVLGAGPSAERADPAASLAVALLVLLQAVRLVRESADVLLESTPGDVDVAELRRAITAVRGVDQVHDLHVWSLSSEYRALSAHLLLTGHPTLEEAQATGERVRREVRARFGIDHTTFEAECEPCEEVAGADVESATVPPGAQTRRNPE